MQWQICEVDSLSNNGIHQLVWSMEWVVCEVYTPPIRDLWSGGCKPCYSLPGGESMSHTCTFILACYMDINSKHNKWYRILTTLLLTSSIWPPPLGHCFLKFQRTWECSSKWSTESLQGKYPMLTAPRYFFPAFLGDYSPQVPTLRSGQRMEKMDIVQEWHRKKLPWGEN